MYNPMVPKMNYRRGVEANVYKQMVICLMYLFATRLSLAYLVFLMARYTEKTNKIHMTTLKSIINYLKWASSFGFM